MANKQSVEQIKAKLNKNPSNLGLTLALVEALLVSNRKDGLQSCIESIVNSSDISVKIQLARLLISSHAYTIAVQVYAILFKQAIQDSDLWTDYAHCLLKLEKNEAALNACHQAIALDDKHFNAYCLWISMLLNSDPPRALQVVPRCLEACEYLDDQSGFALSQPWLRDYCIKTALVAVKYLMVRGQLDRAEVWLNKLFQLDENNQEAIILLANINIMRGKNELAKQALLELYAKNKNNAQVIELLTYLRYPLALDHLLEVEKNHIQLDEAKVILNFAIAKTYHRQGRVSQAAQAYKKANAYRYSYLKASNYYTQAMFESVINTFSQGWFDKQASVERGAQQIFIIGMPRSGSTVVEQVLASHPQIETAGELAYIPEICQTFEFPEATNSLNEEQWHSFAEQYQQQCMKTVSAKEKIIDKLPFNFVYLGVIAKLFPGCKIIHTVRNPIDTCLSCYFTDFKQPGLKMMSDMEELVGFYQRYIRLMQHWHEVLPLPIYTVNNADLIEQPERITRELSAFLEIDWQDTLLEFSRDERAVTTASVMQIRKGLFKKPARYQREYLEYFPQLQQLVTPEGWGK